MGIDELLKEVEENDYKIDSAVGSIDKLDVAEEYFELAIECFLDREQYASAIHLAGAAQEIFGKWVRVNGGKNFSLQMLDESEKMYKDRGHDFDRKQLIKMDKVPKNSLKHMDSETDRFVFINLKLEAFILLGEVMMDRFKAGRQDTASTDRFKESMRKMVSERRF